MPDDTAPKVIYRKDYTPPPFLIDRIDLTVDLGEESTLVRARLAVRRNPAGKGDGALRLDGNKLELVSVTLDDQPLTPEAYEVTPQGLTLAAVPDAFMLETEVRIRPQDNTELEGLYKSGGMFCTQCEAEGFRRITYFLDRPDVMARYTTEIRADKARYPVLLSNGNRVAEGALEGGRHFVRWEDPFPKPAYLFALVAGSLDCLEDTFVTRSGRNVALRIYARSEDLGKCTHAMESLKRSMRWDEEVYGLEYDLDIFMIVAVGDFNMGAMENKGLNIFNTKYVLARPETATDFDHNRVEAVIAHEYFHNWTGNRVTCRDWFQLSLKEGLTVFRDQQFSADMMSPAVKRISDVRVLRARQFPEDASPMAHPVRPDSYIEINNFYTPTVYEKGAEVIGMMHRLLGPEAYRKGIELYFERHDGQAVTCDDFVTAMEDASGVDLRQFRLWYSQAGTPELTVSRAYDPQARALTLTVEQQVPPTPGQPEKRPMHIPLAVGLLDQEGREVPVVLPGEPLANIGGTRLLDVRSARDSFSFQNLPEEPVVSVLRGFSAPVKLKMDRSDAELQFLMANDPDPFARWEAGQQLAVQLILGLVADRKAGRPLAVQPGFVEAFGRALEEDGGDKAFAAEMLTLPGEDYLGELMEEIDVDGIFAAREFVRRVLATELADRFREAYVENDEDGPYRYTTEAVGRRALKNLALIYLVLSGDLTAAELCLAQLRDAGNMTDELGALHCLAYVDRDKREGAISRFYEKWRHDPLVLDKWFAVQAGFRLPETLERVKALVSHPAFDPKNPNKLYALVGTFAHNHVCFHDVGGEGYALLADQVVTLDPHNGIVAARLLTPLGRWRRYDPARQALMRAQLERILAQPGLSKNTFEIASKSLG